MKRVLWAVVSTALFLLFCASCAIHSDVSSADVVQPEEESAIVIVSAQSELNTTAPTLSPTATPEPTATPTPTDTPVPTATPFSPVVFDPVFYVMRPGREAEIKLVCGEYRSLNEPIPVEIRLADGTVVGTADVGSRETVRAVCTLPDGLLPRTTLYLWQEGGTYPISTLDVAVTDANYQPISGNYDRSDKMVALTFDCAYGEPFTDYLLDTLRDYQIHVTFFMTGGWINTHGPWIETMIADGHEIGNHTLTHIRFSQSTALEIEREISGVSDKLLENFNYTTQLLRPPYGSRTEVSDAVTRYLGCDVIMWAIDSHDWDTSYTASKIISRVLDNVKPGDIILFHNAAPLTDRTLVPILDSLIEQGYTFGTVSELIGTEEH